MLLVSLKQRFSTGGHLLSRGHLAISGDIVGCRFG